MLYWQVSEPSCAPVTLGAVLQFSSTDLRRRVSSRNESEENWKCIACTSNNLLFNGYRGSLPGLKRPGRKVDHSPPSSAPLPPSICFHGVDRDKFIFSLPATFTVYVVFRSSKGKGCEANHSCLSVPRLWTNEIIHSLFHVSPAVVLR